MTIANKLKEIQADLVNADVDGWLVYDFRRSNPLGCAFLEIPTEKIMSRRFFYWVPACGTPSKIVHSVDVDSVKEVPGKNLTYSTWQQLEEHIGKVLKGKKRIMMEYSPRNAIPYVSKVDAGTMEVIREHGVEVLSSADLLQKFTSVWTDEQLQMHLESAHLLDTTVGNAWDFIRESLNNNKTIKEYDVVEFIHQEFIKNGHECADLPFCCVNANSAAPHYNLIKETCATIKKGDFILIDLWCKKKAPNAVYADITRMGVAAEKPTAKQQEVFDIVKKARDAATAFVKQRVESGKTVMGWEIDQTSRDVITAAGYGKYFVHRTGHNIGLNDHGDGAHIDNFETQDQRSILPGTCFSIEPGIYLPGEFGVRLEYDVYVDHNKTIRVTGGIQNELVCLF